MRPSQKLRAVPSLLDLVARFPSRRVLVVGGTEEHERRVAEKDELPAGPQQARRLRNPLVRVGPDRGAVLREDRVARFEAAIRAGAGTAGSPTISVALYQPPNGVTGVGQLVANVSGTLTAANTVSGPTTVNGGTVGMLFEALYKTVTNHNGLLQTIASSGRQRWPHTIALLF